MGVAYNWSTAQRADRHPDLTLCVCYVGRCKSCHERSPTALPRHILSPNHFLERQSRASEWRLSPPDGMVGAASFSHLVVRGSASFTCGRWCLPSCAWNARLQCCTNASERLHSTLYGSVGFPQRAIEDRVGPILLNVGGRAVSEPLEGIPYQFRK